jgi:hypothetical protein
MSIYTRDYRLLQKWQRYGQSYPPQPKAGRTFWFLKHSDLRERIQASIPMPPYPNHFGQGELVIGYLLYPFEKAFSTSIGGGLAVNIVLPIFVLDILCLSHGLVSVIILTCYYLYFHPSFAEKIKQERRDRIEAEMALAGWQEVLAKRIDEFRMENSPQLVTYEGHRIGKSAPLLFNALRKIGVADVLEAVPEAAPYTTANGTYSADIGIIDKQLAILLDVEIDERHHFDDFEQWCHDRHRNQIFLRHGWSVIRFSEDEVINDPQACAQDVASVLADLRKRNAEIFEEMKKPTNWCCGPRKRGRRP